jgi:hypothetical protein
MLKTGEMLIDKILDEIESLTLPCPLHKPDDSD